MEKLDPKKDGRSPDVISENIEKLRELFPEAFTEGSDEDGPRWKVDFDALKEIIGEYGEKEAERYSFTWHGKSRARLIAQTPSTSTLRPCPEESVNWDTTKNLFIEGDNLEVLKLLQKSYHKKVKMIYIDPPYNTGNDFIYPDKFADNLDTYLRYTGQIDDEGFKVSTNAETGGRYHTNWLNMMYPRLKLARNLLKDDGVIFISIDDNEKANLRHVCNDVFGEENFIGEIAWKHTQQSKNDEPYFSRHYNSLLVYSKTERLSRFRFPRTDEDNANYSNPDNDPKGDWRSGDVRSPNPRPTLRYRIETPSGKFIDPPENGWRWSKGEVERKIENGEIVFNDVETKIIRKIYLANQEGRTPENLWSGERYGTTRQANSELKAVFDGTAVFDTPKPTSLIRSMIQLACESENDIVMDFFAGSCSTGHAVWLQSINSTTPLRFVMVQLPEQLQLEVKEQKAAFEFCEKNGLRPTVAEIGKERLRRVTSELIKGAALDTIDLGFRVFELDSSNIKPWDADFDNVERALLDSVDNIKSDRSEEDVLYELLLKYGLDLAVPIETHTVVDKKVYVVGGGALIVSLADGIDAKLAEGIVSIRDEIQPEVIRVVFKDSGFKDDVAKTNVMQVLKQAGIEDVKSL